MLEVEDYDLINSLKQHAVYQKDIAEELGVHPKTVSRSLKRGAAPTKIRKQQVSELDPYKGTVD